MPASDDRSTSGPAEVDVTIDYTVGAARMEVWRERDIDSKSLVPDARGSLRPVDKAAEQVTITPWSEQADGESLTSGIELGMVLGEGGMGIVRAATQLALRRSVAVKEVRADSASPSAIAALLREARRGSLPISSIPISSRCTRSRRASTRRAS